MILKNNNIKKTAKLKLVELF